MTRSSRRPLPTSPQTIFFPSSFFVSNIFEGLIWFLLPAALVIINDIAAYLAGRRVCEHP